MNVVGTMFFKDEKLLIDKPRKRQTYQMIGGRVEEGETPLEAAIRECHEELGKDAIFDENKIIGSVRGNLQDNTVYIGKLMVHPDYRNRGLGSKLLLEIENYFPKSRYELFTSTQSAHNIRLYEEVGYVAFDQRKVDDKLTFVYLEKQ